MFHLLFGNQETERMHGSYKENRRNVSLETKSNNKIVSVLIP